MHVTYEDKVCKSHWSID